MELSNTLVPGQDNIASSDVNPPSRNDEDALALDLILDQDTCPRFIGKIALNQDALILSNRKQEYTLPNQRRSPLIRLLKTMDGSHSLKNLHQMFGNSDPEKIDSFLLQLLDWQLVQLTQPSANQTGKDAYQVLLNHNPPMPLSLQAFMAQSSSQTESNNCKIETVLPGLLIEVSHILRHLQSMLNSQLTVSCIPEDLEDTATLKHKIKEVQLTILKGLEAWDITFASIQSAIPLPYTAAIYASLTFHSRRDRLLSIALLERLIHQVQQILHESARYLNSDSITFQQSQAIASTQDHFRALDISTWVKQQFTQEEMVFSDRLAVMHRNVKGFDELLSKFIQETVSYYRNSLTLRTIF